MRSFCEVVNLLHNKETKFSDMVEFREVLKELFEDLKENYNELYCKTIEKLESIAYRISKDEAKKIVMKMKPYGEKWSYETIINYLDTKDIIGYYVEYYLVMNMVYNDYYDVAVNFGHSDDVEFYFQLAYSFINDEDAKKFKVERYFID